MELTKQEYTVAELLTRGKSEKEIASELFISPKTVNNHTYNIRKKWNARCAVDIARTFILGLEEPKKFFISVLFLIIQGHIMFNCVTMDLRRPSRASGARTVRISRKIEA